MAEVSAEIATRRTGFAISGSDDDRSVMGILAETGSYEPDVLAFLDALVGEDWVCIDGGANVGIISVLLAHLAPRGRVLAFEPEPQSYGWLQQNVAQEAPADVVSTDPRALGNRSGGDVINVDPRFPAGAFLSDLATDELAHDIEITTIDDVVAARGLDRVDLVKLDIEGSEVDALAGATTTLATHRPHLLVEANPVALQRFRGMDALDLWDAIPSTYRRRYVVTADGSLNRLFHPRHLQLMLGRLGRVDLFATTTTDDVIGDVVLRVNRRSALDAARTLRHVVRSSGVDAMDVVFPAPGHVSVEIANPLPQRIPVGQAVRIDVRLRNRSVATLTSDALRHPAFVGVRLRTDDGWIDTGERWCLPGPLRPGRSALVRGLYRPPQEPGRLVIGLDVVVEGHAWLGGELRTEGPSVAELTIG